MAGFILNVRYAFRKLWRACSFAVTAILTLALGIGANAVVFSVLNAVVLHPVNVPHALSLYMVQRGQYPPQSYKDYLDLRDRNRTFESLMMYDIMGPVGVVENGKYRSLTEDQWPAMFFSFQQQHSSDTWLLVRSSRNPEIARALRLRESSAWRLIP